MRVPFLANCCFICAAGAALAQDGRPTLGSPLGAAGVDDARGAVLRLDASALAGLRATQAARLEGFPLPGGGSVTLELQQFDAFAPDARLVVVGGAGARALPRPDLTLFSGRIADEPDSFVVLGFGAQGSTYGVLTRGATTMILSSGAAGSGNAPVIYELNAVAAQWISSDWRCAADRLARSARARPAGGDAGVRTFPCRIADVAIDTDHDYRLLFTSTPAASAYTSLMIGAVSEIFARDTGLRTRISFLRLWETPNDPWGDPNNTVEQLFEFQDFWNLNMGGVERDVALFLSGRQLGGGVAYLDGACNALEAYALSADLNGFFPYPTVHNHVQNWDPFVTAHELGHLFGALHTHDLTPPADRCGLGDCSAAPNGTIMSYCHGCGNGMLDVRMEFHPRSVSENIAPLLDSECASLGAPPTAAAPDGASLCTGANHTLNVVAAGGGTLTYLWRRDTLEIAGATAASYQIVDADAGDAGSYDCVVSNECGSVISGAALVEVCDNAADTNADCVTDLDDLLVVLGNFGTPSGASRAEGDLDGDGDVDLDDLLFVLGNFDQGC